MYNNKYSEMNMIRWFIWGIFILWVFFLPNNIPSQKNKKNSPLDILRKRFASEQISSEEFLAEKKFLR